MPKPFAVLAAVAVLALGACATRPLPPEQAPLAPGFHLARQGLSADGANVFLAGDAPGRCFGLALHAAGLAEAPPRATAEGPPRDDDGRCAAVAVAAAADGRTFAVHAYNLGEVRVLRREGGRLVADGDVLRLPGEPGFPYPPPGPTLSLAADGTALLVGALERRCRPLGSGVRCGEAYLYRRGPDGWRLAATLARPAGAGEAAHFGQSVLILPDGAALVGGNGIADAPGALHLFVPRGGAGRYELAQTLGPADGVDEFFATDLAASGDGGTVAVGVAQGVVLYSRAGDRLEAVARLDPPEERAGHFGDAVALDGTGATLLVGAPRAACPAGPRCGIAYLYRRDGETWVLTGPVRAGRELPQAVFGREVALDVSGTISAVEGRGVEVERRDGRR